MPWKRPPRGHELLGRTLDVLDAGAGRHPLGGAVGDEAAAAGGVLVLEGAVHDVGDGLEAAVRVPGRAFGLPGRVLDGADVVEEQEGVGERKVGAGEGTPDDEALAFELTMGGDDLDDGPPGGPRLRHGGEAGQGEGVGCNCWHCRCSEGY